MYIRCHNCGSTSSKDITHVGKLREPRKWNPKLPLPDETERYHGENCIESCPTEEHFHVICSCCKTIFRVRHWNGELLYGVIRKGEG